MTGRQAGGSRRYSVATASLPDPGSDEPERDPSDDDRDREADEGQSESRDVRHAGRVEPQAGSIKAFYLST